jgi:hypothetical protein
MTAQEFDSLSDVDKRSVLVEALQRRVPVQTLQKDSAPASSGIFF